ncbi:hypothetical protein K493DRAFT_322102, partial [Basidiobolus meristosporus CBS 931.73]
DTGASRVETVKSIALVKEDQSVNTIFTKPNASANTWGSVQFTLPDDVPSGGYYYQVTATTNNNEKCVFKSNRFQLIQTNPKPNPPTTSTTGKPTSKPTSEPTSKPTNKPTSTSKTTSVKPTTTPDPEVDGCKGWRLTSPPNIPGINYNVGTGQVLSWDTGASSLDTVKTVAIVKNDNTVDQIFLHPNQPANTWGYLSLEIPNVPTGDYRYQVIGVTKKGKKCTLNSNPFHVTNPNHKPSPSPTPSPSPSPSPKCKGWRITAPPLIPGLTWNTGTGQSISWDTGASKVQTINSVALVKKDGSYKKVFTRPNKPADTWGSIEFTLPVVSSGDYHYQVISTTKSGAECQADSNPFHINKV